MREGLVAEALWRFEPGSIAINATHARIPLYEHLNAGYGMRFHEQGESESGVTRLQWLKNPVSILSERTVLGAAAKAHTMEHNGVHWHTRSADRVRAEQSNRDAATTARAAQTRETRDTMVGAYVGQIELGEQLTESAQDVEHLEQIRTWVDTDDAKQSVAGRVAGSSWASLRGEAKEGTAKAATQPSIKTDNICLHLERAAGMGSTEDFYEVPLDTIVVGYRGMATTAPMRVFSVLAGTVVFSVDAGAVEVHFAASLAPSLTSSCAYSSSLPLLHLESRLACHPPAPPIACLAQPTHPLCAPLPPPPPPPPPLQASQHLTVQMDLAASFSHEGLAPTALVVGPADGKNMAVSDADGRLDKFIQEASFASNQLFRQMMGMPIDYSRFSEDPEALCTPACSQKSSQTPPEGSHVFWSPFSLG